MPVKCPAATATVAAGRHETVLDRMLRRRLVNPPRRGAMVMIWQPDSMDWER